MWLLPLAAALKVGSFFMQKKADSDVRSAQSSAMQDYNERRRELEAKSQQAALKTQSNAADFTKQQAASEVATKKDYAAQNRMATPGGRDVAAATNQPMVTGLSKDLAAQSAAYLGQQDTALAGLRSFGDILTGQNIALNRGLTDAAKYGDFMAGLEGPMKQRMQDALADGATPEMIANIMSSLGDMALMGGLSGVGAGAGAAGGASGTGSVMGGGGPSVAANVPITAGSPAGPTGMSGGFLSSIFSGGNPLQSLASFIPAMNFMPNSVMPQSKMTPTQIQLARTKFQY